MKKNLSYYEENPLGFFSKETIRVIKLTFFLLMLTFSQLFATETYSQMTKLTLKLEDVKISDVMKDIENQSEFYFLYSPKLIDVDKKVSITADKETINDILSEIFDKNVKFAVNDRQITLTSEDQPEILSEVQQQKLITGTVTQKGWYSSGWCRCYCYRYYYWCNYKLYGQIQY